MDSVASPNFSVSDFTDSHALNFFSDQFSYASEGESGGQLVVCNSGELFLFGHAGEWSIPAGHMVYIPPERVFKILAKAPSAGQIVKFCRREVDWQHDGCWVGRVSDFARTLLTHAQKWTEEESRNRKAKCFFVTLADMVPGWFRNERIQWTPHAHSKALQRALDFARARGPRVALPDVARVAGMSERTLRRHLQQELSQSWRDFIKELRMNRAMDMLRKEHKSVTETAYDVGFSSSSAFSSAFLAYVGKTPSVYAKSFLAA